MDVESPHRMRYRYYANTVQYLIASTVSCCCSSEVSDHSDSPVKFLLLAHRLVITIVLYNDDKERKISFAKERSEETLHSGQSE